MTSGDKVGPYEIVELLGSGAMGDVYRATDSKMYGRVVALKILSERLSSNEQACERFKREVEVAANLVHPNIVTIHDRGEHEGRPFFVMEYLEGVDLGRLILEPASRDLENRIDLACQMCDALQHAHEHVPRVVHRDIKPSNIVICNRGGRDQAKLVDFGIAHVERSSLTRASTQPGTFSYMSPEQLRNEPNLDHTSDLFSLGIVFYEMFTGTHPFEAASEALITGRILRDEPEPARSRSPEIPAALDSLILKLLEKEPSQRPQNARQVGEALRNILRKIQTRGGSTDPSDYDKLDDLTRQMVENLVTWARKKEAEGALPEALEAYEKAHRLAPDSERLKLKLPKLRHRIESEKRLRELLDQARESISRGRIGEARHLWRDAWIQAPESEEVASLDREIAALETLIPEDRERAAFVEERMRKAESALDQGRLDDTSSTLAEILKRYPDEPLAVLMLDRLFDIRQAGVDYGAYRAALRDARGALAEGRYPEAAAACSRARGIWPGDEEAEDLEREVATRRQEEIRSLMRRGERHLAEAEELAADEARALRAVEESLAAIGRARDLGAEDSWIRPVLDEARRRQEDLRERSRARERQEAEREEQRRRIVTTNLQRGKNLEDTARSLRKRGLLDAAFDPYRQARKAYEEVLEKEPGNAEASEAIRRIGGEEADLGRQIEAERSRDKQAAESLAAARSYLEQARGKQTGEDGDLEHSRFLVEEGLAAADAVLRLRPGHEEASALKAELSALGDAVRAEIERRESQRRDAAARRQEAIDTGLAEGRESLARARSLAGGDIGDVREVVEECLRAEKAFGRVLTLEPDRAEAREAMDELRTLAEHARSEVRRREKREKEDDERMRRERIESLEGEIRRQIEIAEPLAGGSIEDLEKAKGACDATMRALEALGAEDPANDAAGRLKGALETVLSAIALRQARLKQEEAESADAERRKRLEEEDAKRRRVEEDRRKEDERKTEARRHDLESVLAEGRGLVAEASELADDPRKALHVADLLAAARRKHADAIAIGPDSEDAATLLSAIDEVERIAGPLVEKSRQRAIKEFRSGIAKARSLAGQRRRKDALAIVAELEEEARISPSLGEALTELQALRDALRREGSGRAKWVLLGAAACVAVAVAVWVIVSHPPAGDAVGQAQRARDAQAQREREAQAQRETDAQAQKDRVAQVQRERETQAQRETDAQAQKDRDAQAQKEREAQAQRERDARAQKDRDAQAQKESNRREKDELAKLEAERLHKAKEERERADSEPAAAVVEGATIEGRVLCGNQPLEGMAFVFVDTVSGQEVETRSGANGRYSVRVPFTTLAAGWVPRSFADSNGVERKPTRPPGQIRVTRDSSKTMNIDICGR